MENKVWYKYFRVINGQLVSSFIDPNNTEVKNTDTCKRLDYYPGKITMAPEGSQGIVITDEKVIRLGNVFFGNASLVRLYRITPIGPVTVAKHNDGLPGHAGLPGNLVCPGIRVGAFIAEVR